MAATYIKFSTFSPIKFKDDSIDVNYSTVFPNGSNQLPEEMKYGGTIPLPIYQGRITNTTFKFQVISDATSSSDFTTYIGNSKCVESAISSNKIEITPTGWTGDNIWEIEISMVTPPIVSPYVGLYYFKIEISNKTYVSEWINFQETLESHVKITYGNSENKYGMIFYDTTTTPNPTSYDYLFYLPGNFVNNILAGGESSVYEDEVGNDQVLNGTPKRVFNLKFPALPGHLAEKMQFVFKNLDTIEINGVDVVAPEGAELSQLSEFFNAYSVSIVCNKQDWDYLENS